MQYFVYIGKDSKTINLFSKLSIGVFYAASNCNQAIKVLDKIREKYDTALFFEQINLSQDIANIHYMRKKYPGLYMVLVIDSLSKEEAPEYLKAGINNTIKYETNPESLQALSTFLKHRKDQKIQALQLKTQNLNAFRLPLWKRAFDIVFSGMALLCLSPLLILTALAIRLESKGPIIYKSKRVGSNYLIFDFLKFRSMYTDADKHLKDFNTLNQYQQEEEQEEALGIENEELKDFNGMPRESIFKFMEFDEVKDNMIIRKNRSQYVMIIQCSGVNYDLMSEDEKIAVEEGFVQFLNTLRFPIQLYIQTRSLNLRDIVDEYKNKVSEIAQDIEKVKTRIQAAKDTKNERLLQKLQFEKTRKERVLDYGLDITEYVARMSLNKNVLQQRTYLILSYYASEAGASADTPQEEIDGMCFSELYTRAQTAITSFRSNK